MSYWKDSIDSAGQVPRKDWNDYWEKLVNEKIVDASEREEFDNGFTRTQRSAATPRPSLVCAFPWSLDEAEQVDSLGKLAMTVKDRLNQLLGAIGEDLVK